MPKLKEGSITQATERKLARTWMLDKLAQSGLDHANALQLHIESYTEKECEALKLTRSGMGFKIPYYSPAGKLLPTYRYRFAETEVPSGLLKGTKLAKYLQPPGTDPELYLPQLAGVNWPSILATPDVRLYITEGELKAAAATKLNFPTLGLGGVYSFGCRAKHQEFIPAMQAVKWKGRDVYIVFDSDAVTNPDVLKAESRLARLLMDRGAEPHIVRLPPGEQGTKIGLDDYLVTRGAPAFEALVDATERWGQCAPLYELNSRFAHILRPSMVVEFPTKDEPEFNMDTVAKFTRETHADIFIDAVTPTGRPTKRKAAEAWIEWPQRNKLMGVVYEPGKPRLYKNRLNMWEEWAVKPVPGSITPFTELMNHIFKDNPEHMRWFLQWIAYPLQHPGTKLKQACVFWSSDQGTGKSIIGYTLQKIYGKNFDEIDKTHLTNSFNSWTVNKQFIMGAEITGGSGRDVADVLKNMITGTDVRVNEKYKPEYTIRNCVNFYFTSNHPDAFFIDDKDRRYFVHEVPPTTGLRPGFFDVYDKWYKSAEGPAALFHWLLGLDLTGFNPQGHAPKTDSRNEMVAASQSELGAWIMELSKYPDNVLRIGETILPFRLWTVDDLMRIYTSNGQITKNAGPGAMARALSGYFHKINKREAVDVGNGVRKHVWAIRDPKDVELGYRAGSDQYQRERNKLKPPSTKHAKGFGKK